MEHVNVLLLGEKRERLNEIFKCLDKEKDVHVFTVVSLSKATKINFRVDFILVDCDSVNDYEHLPFIRDWNAVAIYTRFTKKNKLLEAFKKGFVHFLLVEDIYHLPTQIRRLHRYSNMTNIDFLKLLKEEYLQLKRIETKYEYEKNSSKLTSSEINILKYIEKGYTQSQIAAELFISIRTVKNHISNILKKTKLNSSKEAAIKARELELL